MLVLHSEDQNSVPSTHNKTLTASVIPAPGVITLCFEFCRHYTLVDIHIQTETHIHIVKKNKSKDNVVENTK